MNKEYYIGLDIGGTKCAASLGLIGDSIEIKEREAFPTEGKTPEEVLILFSEFINKQKETKEIKGIGISSGGPLDSRRGVIMKPPSLPLWDNIEIVNFFEERFGTPTFLQNDANASAVAEWKYGAGRGSSNMVFLTFGTGLGAGLILNGRLYTGANDNAGEIGHIRLTRGGPVGYNKAGSAEGYSSGSGIRRLAEIMAEREARRGRCPEAARLYGKDNLTAKILAERAYSGDEFALSVFRKSGEMLGRTLAVLIDVINPEKIIIGGVYMRAENLIYPHARRVIEREALGFSRDVCEILPAGLSENIGDYAALSCAKGDF